MRKIFKQVISFFLVPLTRRYLRKQRKYSYQGTTVTVYPGVFHPGLFYSTKFLLEYLPASSAQESLLELGCGSGMISVIASKKGFRVTASDLSRLAVENTVKNAADNNALITVIHSDLFDKIEATQFDWIIINPPYYARAPKKEEELAWHCGENFDYFQKLFSSLEKFMHPATRTIMVLTLGSERGKIFAIGHSHGFQFELVREKNVLFDGKDFLYQIKRSAPGIG